MFEIWISWYGFQKYPMVKTPFVHVLLKSEISKITDPPVASSPSAPAVFFDTGSILAIVHVQASMEAARQGSGDNVLV